ncbi:MAG TPA: Gmad2 immunoglobulin-like domain-containing protein [Sporichthya sp.]|nr:Gmad2 immunoglobulin-like domain-containing protein [Sporichthya sp.]
MSEYGSRFGRPDPDPNDVEARLAAALRAEADRVMPAGDGLTKIRARTSARRGAFGWFANPGARPALAAGTLVVALVAGTAIGLQLTGGGGDGTNVADGGRDPVARQPFGSLQPLVENDQADSLRYNPDPGPDLGGGTGGDTPPVTTQVTQPPTNNPLRIAPVTPEQDQNKSDNGIPVDDGGTYVAITAPLSGRSYNSPLTLAGQARVFEAQVTIDVSQNGRVLEQTHAMATKGAPELGDWQVTIDLAPGNYRIDAYALSAKDGTTKMASDSIWITIKGPSGATGPTPTPTPSPLPSPTPTSAPPTSAPPSSAPQTQQVPGAEP